MGAPPPIRYQMQSQTSSISADFLKYSGHRLNLRELSDDNPNQRTLQRLGAAGRNPQRLQEEACCEGGRRAIRRVRPAAFFLFFCPLFCFCFFVIASYLKNAFWSRKRYSNWSGCSIAERETSSGLELHGPTARVVLVPRDRLSGHWATVLKLTSHYVRALSNLQFVYQVIVQNRFTGRYLYS